MIGPTFNQGKPGFGAALNETAKYLQQTKATAGFSNQNNSKSDKYLILRNVKVRVLRKDRLLLSCEFTGLHIFKILILINCLLKDSSTRISYELSAVEFFKYKNDFRLNDFQKFALERVFQQICRQSLNFSNFAPQISDRLYQHDSLF